MLTAAEPVISAARRRVMAAMGAMGPGVFPASTVDLAALVDTFEASLRRRLLGALSKTLVLELALASRRKLLLGDSAEDRFSFFCDCLADPAFACLLLEQYPALVRRVVTIAGDWEASTVLMVERLAASWPTLRREFFGDDGPGPLVSATSAGDTHRGGQSIHILRFQSGGKLIYKPRPVAMEACYFDIVAWLNLKGFHPDLKQVGVLDEGEFGWMEFVEERPCQTRDQLERFFARQGVQIALAYAIGAADLHSENVIAHGEYPVLVDLEMLFQSPIQTGDLAGATAAAWRALQTSVMGTLLLPEPLFLSGDGRWVDISALGHGEGQLTPFPVPVWDHGGTDRMRLAHRRIPLEDPSSLPNFEDAREPGSRHVESIVQGFRGAYALLQGHAAELLADSGPLSGGFGKPARRVFRDTGAYVRLIEASHHPRYLDDGISLEAFLHNALRAGSASAPWLSSVEEAEVTALIRADVPYFSSVVGDASETSLPGDGWRDCRARIAALCDQDRDFQTGLMRVAMTDFAAPADVATRSHVGFKAAPDADQLVATARRIGDRLCELAIVDNDRATWLVPAAVNDTRLSSGVAGVDLYGGLPGIALFLGRLGATVGEPRYSWIATAAMDEALALYRAAPGKLRLGAYDGTGGIAYVLAHLAGPLRRPEWVAAAGRFMQDAAGQIPGASGVDIVSGDAGFLVAALALCADSATSARVRRLRPSAEELKRRAEASDGPGSSQFPGTADAGIAHGRAGVALALLRWAEATGDAGYREAAARMIRLDWEAVDVRRTESSELAARRGRYGSDLGWCRGWLGTALVALQAGPGFHVAPDQDQRIRRLGDDIVRFGVDGPLCLCHGALGHLELLDAAAQRGLLNDASAATAWRGRLLARLAGGDWVANVGDAIEAPGLMLGLAGTGYALLRAASPRRSPSVLTLDSPGAPTVMEAP